MTDQPDCRAATLLTMLIRTLHDVAGTDRDAGGEGWRALRLVTRDDGLGFSLSETTVEAGTQLDVWYKHHEEACYVIEGEAEITERETGTTHRIRPGSAYAPRHEPHVVRVISPLRLVCVFNPALTGRETHDADGSYPTPDE
jgi:L-ectoine synthase